MHFLRKAGLYVTVSLLPVLLFALGFSWSMYQVYGKPDHIKNALDKSGIYDSLVSDALAQANQEGQADIPLDRPEVRDIAQNAASPDYIKSQTEGFVDNLYSWMKGDSPELQFQIDLTDAKARLANGLAQYAADRAAHLPSCTEPIDPVSFDALNASCVPVGADRATIAEQVRNQVNAEVLKDPVLTQNEVKSDSGQPIQQQFSAVPNVYEQLVKSMWLSAILIVLFTAAVIGFSRPWRAGLKRAGIIYLVIGIVGAFIAVCGAFALQSLMNGIAGETPLQASLMNVADVLVSQFRNWWLIYSVVILALGLAALIALKWVKAGKDKEPEKPESANKPHPKNDGSPQNPAITKTI